MSRLWGWHSQCDFSEYLHGSVVFQRAAVLTGLRVRGNTCVQAVVPVRFT